MLITEQNEIISLMPTARWDRPQQLFGYIEEEETVALEPLLGNTLYQWLIAEYDRLRKEYTDITATTVRPSGMAKKDARLAHADVTERLEQIQQGKYRETYEEPDDGEKAVPADDMLSIRLIRICQQIEFYKMLSHKAGLLTVSFNEGGGMNMVSADGYEPADEKRLERVAKDAYMSAGRSIDTLLLFLEADAKGARKFTKMWSEANAFYLHKDLLFQTARTLNEYLDINGQRMAYVALVRDIRFCQNTYLKPRVGAKLLNKVVEFANEGIVDGNGNSLTPNPSPGRGENDNVNDNENGNPEPLTLNPEPITDNRSTQTEIYSELLSLLRTALAFYVEARRVSLEPVKEKLARRDSMTDAQQAMAAACEYIEENLDALGEAAVGTPIYNLVRAREEQKEKERTFACAAEARRRKEACEQQNRMLFTSFPMTHRPTELK